MFYLRKVLNASKGYVLQRVYNTKYVMINGNLEFILFYFLGRKNASGARKSIVQWFYLNKSCLSRYTGSSSSTCYIYRYPACYDEWRSLFVSSSHLLRKASLSHEFSVTQMLQCRLTILCIRLARCLRLVLGEFPDKSISMLNLTYDKIIGNVVTKDSK